jgi:hypothetical protein
MTERYLILSRNLDELRGVQNEGLSQGFGGETLGNRGMEEIKQ